MVVVEELVEDAAERFDLFGKIGLEVEEFPSECSVEGFDMSVELGRLRRQDREEGGVPRRPARNQLGTRSRHRPGFGAG